MKPKSQSEVLSTTTVLQPAPPSHFNAGSLFTPLTPPPNFGRVESGVLRSAYPTELHHVAFLRQHLGIRTIVALSIEAMPCNILSALIGPSPPSGGVTIENSGPPHAAAPSVLHFHLEGCHRCRGGGGSYVFDDVHPIQPSSTRSGFGCSTTTPPEHNTAMSSRNASFCGLPPSSPYRCQPTNPQGNLFATSRSSDDGGVWKRTNSVQQSASNVGMRCGVCACGRRDTITLVRDALDIVLDASYHPVLLCCPSGEAQTTLVVGCLRSLQRWCLASILQEADAFASLGYSRASLRSSLEQFSPDIAQFQLMEMTRRKSLREGRLKHQQRFGDTRSVLRFILTGGRYMPGSQGASVTGGSAVVPNTVVGGSRSGALHSSKHQDSAKGWCGQERAAQAASSILSFQHAGLPVPAPLVNSCLPQQLHSSDATVSDLEACNSGGAFLGWIQHGHTNHSASHHHRRSGSDMVGNSPGLHSSFASRSVTCLGWDGGTAHGFDSKVEGGAGQQLLSVVLASNVLEAALRWNTNAEQETLACLPDRFKRPSDGDEVNKPLAPHERYWPVRNPPPIDTRSTFNKNESLVEEDDD